jgi:Family of unknown function (DUF6152)
MIARWLIPIMLAGPLLAHHSLRGTYDVDTVLTYQGVITGVEWMNPHARVFVDVKDDAGAVGQWIFEMGPPNALLLRGWTRDSVKTGDSVTIAGHPAKDGAKLGAVTTITLADGAKLVSPQGWNFPAMNSSPMDRH